MKAKSILLIAFLTGLFSFSATVYGNCNSDDAYNFPEDTLTKHHFLTLDPQRVEDQDEMTWADYHPVPGKDWTDTAIVPTIKKIRIAILVADFDDQPFVITLPKHSDLFGNPQIDPILRENVAKFYNDFWNKPQAVNHWQTINGYWMEQSKGRFGIQTHAFGPYRMPKKAFQYGLAEWGQDSSAPAGYKADGRLDQDVDSLWKMAEGKDIEKDYDIILRVFAGYDETCVWQEFGEMKFLNKESIPAEWGNPDTTKPRWAPTRYIPWTSWKAAEALWANSAIITGECSGAIRHEISHHEFHVGDNNNNPYVEPYRRVGSGPWDLMDRGCFNGPGGPHMRWHIPVVDAGLMSAGLMLRQRMLFKFTGENSVLSLSRKQLTKKGVAVTKVTAREVEPLPGEYTGIVVRLDGRKPHDHTPVDDPATNPLSPGIPDYDYYSLEVVQRIGYDSFCPDNGVLIAKNKDKERTNGGKNGFNCFNWVIDAHPEDINKIDFIRPDGTKVMRTIADYRQLNDALFHAGTNSGSSFEYEDTPNRLHFYVIDLKKDSNGILSYTLGVRSLDHKPGKKEFSVQIQAPSDMKVSGDNQIFSFVIKNTGRVNKKAGTCFDSDIYRISVQIEGKGWTAEKGNDLLYVKAGEKGNVPVCFSHSTRCDPEAVVTVTASSESDPMVSSTVKMKIKR